VLSSTKVQTLLANQLSKRFSQNYTNTILLEQFALSLDGRATLKGLMIADHHADTLAYIRQVKLSLADLNALAEGDLRLHSLTLTDPLVKNTHYNNEDTDALGHFFNQLKQADNGPIPISIDQIELKKGAYFAFHPLESKLQAQLDNISLKAVDLTIDGNHIHGKLLQLSGNDMVHNIALQQGQMEFIYTPQKLKIENLYLKSDSDFVAGNIELSDSISISTYWKESARWTVQLDRFSIHSSKWFKLQKIKSPLPKMEGQFFANGSFQHLVVDSLSLGTDWGNINLNGSVYQLTDQSKISFDLQFQSNQLQPKKWGGLFAPAFKDQMSANDFISINGKLKLASDALDYKLNLKGDWGVSLLEGQLGKGFLINQEKNTSFSLSASFNNFEATSFLAANSPITISGKTVVNGTGKNLETLTGAWQMEALTLQLSKLPKLVFNGSGTYGGKQLKSTLTVRSAFLSLKSDWVLDHTLTQPKIATAINVESLDLTHFNPVLGDGKARLKGIILANTTGSHWDNLTGTLTGASLTLETAADTLNFSPLTLSQSWENKERVLAIDNQDVLQLTLKGNYQTAEIVPLFQNTLSEVYTFLPTTQVAPSQSMRFNMRIYEKVLNALYPKLEAQENLRVSGIINSQKKHSQITLDLPFFKWDGFNLENIHFQLDTQNPLYNTYLSADELAYKKEKIKEFNLISTALNDTLFFRSEFNRKENETPFEINFYHFLGASKEVIFGLQPSKLFFGNALWTLNPHNNKNQQFVYDPQRKRWVGEDFLLQSPSAYLSASGFWENEDHLGVHVEAKGVPVNELLTQQETFQSEGVLDVSLDYIRSIEKNDFQLTATWEQMKINERSLGNLTLNGKGNTQLDSYQFQFNLLDQENERLTGSGSVLGWESPRLNFDLNFSAFKLDFLSALGKKALNNIGGELTGAVNLWGPLNRLQHNGTLKLQDGTLNIPFLNTAYAIAEADVNLYEQTFDFQQLKIEDTKENTAAQLKGKINHTNFKDWNAALAISSPRILLLNKPNAPDVLFYGDGYLNGNITLDGPFRNLNLTMVGSTETGTSIKIPWAEDYGLADTSFIEMIDKNKRDTNKAEAVLQASGEQISGLEMNFELDVNPKAEVEIVIDQETGSFLKGSGAGSLFMEINTGGKFNMWGDFITYNGIYNFKNLGVIDKKFDVKPGGTIVWEGDPLNAQMNIEARYEVPGGANPALMLDNPNFNKKIDTNVLIQLQGNLLKPDDPLFEIEFPNTSGTVASEINYRLADPQRRQLQALSLLSQGIFINEVSVSMQGITNNLYQKASDIFSSLLNEDNNKLQIGVDYLQGDKSALLDIATADRLGFTLSTKLSEKILLNGKIGVPVGGVEQTLVVGNVQIDFILNDDGTLKAKVFNKENEFRYISDELGYTQGVGLSYQVDFDTFSDLVQKIVNGAQPSLRPLSVNALAPEEAANIEFVEKK